jgi:hypothetical protein
MLLLRLNDSGTKKMSDYSVRERELVKGKKKYFVRILYKEATFCVLIVILFFLLWQ